MKLLSGKRSNKQLQGYNKTLSLLVIYLFVFGYWLYAWTLERIDYTSVPPDWWQRFVTGFPLFMIFAPVFLFLLELFSPRVLRHLIPVFLGAWMAREVILRFMRSFYELPDDKAAGTLLNRLRASRVPSSPVTSIQDAMFTSERIKNAMLRVGGPGRISIGRGKAVVSERNGHKRQVLGPGSHILGRFEYPSALLDVRPQEREKNSVRLVTLDGMELTTDIAVVFQISKGARSPSRELSFPFDPDAVRRAAYWQTEIGDGEIIDWESIVLITAETQLADLVTEYRLDELIHSEGTGIYPHPKLQLEMERRTKDAMRDFGVEIRGVRLGRFELPDPVVKQNIEYWHAIRDKRKRLQEEGIGPELMEDEVIATAQAEADIIQQVARELQRTPLSSGDANDQRGAAIRFVEKLESMARQSQGVVSLPGHLLPTLDSLHRQLLVEQKDSGHAPDSTGS